MTDITDEQANTVRAFCTAIDRCAPRTWPAIKREMRDVGGIENPVGAMENLMNALMPQCRY